MRKGQQHTLESRQKMSKTKKGKKHSLETRQKISRINQGTKNPMYGKYHSPETKEKMRKVKQGKTLSLEHRQKIGDALRGRRGEATSSWKGGRIYEGAGYILIHAPSHPRARKNGYILEHRLIMGKHIGRPLELWEVVHHINGVRDDNRIENLKLLPKESEHLALRKMEKELISQTQKVEEWRKAYFRLMMTGSYIAFEN